MWSERAYTITAGSGLENGTLELSHFMADANDAVKVRPRPDLGYRLQANSLAGTYGEGGTVSFSDSPDVDGWYSFTMPGGNVTLTAEFEEKEPQTITLATVTGGALAVSVEDAPAEIAQEGETVTVTVTPSEGNYLTGGSLRYVVGANEYPVGKDERGEFSFIMPDTPVTITAEFTDKTVDVTFEVTAVNADDGMILLMGAPGANGGVPISAFHTADVMKYFQRYDVFFPPEAKQINTGEDYKLYGESLTLAVPIGEYDWLALNPDNSYDEYYQQDNWRGRKTLRRGYNYSVRSGGYIDEKIDWREWSDDSEDILLDTGIQNGTLTLDVNNALAGDTVTVTPVPEYGCRLAAGSLTGTYGSDGVISFTPVGDGFTFTMPTPAQEVTLSAVFEEIPGMWHTVGADPGIQNGRVVPLNASWQPIDTVPEGATVNISVKPAKGFELAALTMNGSPAPRQDGAYSFVMPAEDVVLSAVFAPVEDLARVTLSVPQPGDGYQHTFYAHLLLDKNDDIWDNLIIDRPLAADDLPYGWFGWQVPAEAASILDPGVGFGESQSILVPAGAYTVAALTNYADGLGSYLLSGNNFRAKELEGGKQYTLTLTEANDTIEAKWTEQDLMLVTDITLAPAAKTLTEGESFDIAATVLPKDATEPSLQWSSDKPGIAAVDEKGHVAALAPGEAVITAAAQDGSGVTATCAVTVTEAEDSSSDSGSTSDPGSGSDSGSTSDPGSVSVSQPGSDSASQPSSSSGPQGQAPANPVTRVQFGQAGVTLKQGKSITLPAAAYTRDGGSKAKVSYKSSKPTLAKVSKSGKITASKTKTGTAKITATAGGKKATLTVKVVKGSTKTVKVTSVSASIPKTMQVGKTLYLKPSWKPAAAQGVKITYTSSKKTVVTVDKYGRLIAKKQGTALITVKGGGKTRKYTVKVK